MLPIDAACQAAVYRRDRLGALGVAVPRDISAVRELARRGRLACALHGVHALMTFFSRCVGLEGGPRAHPDTPLVEEQTGLAVLELLREIAIWCPPEALDWSSIACLEVMSARDDLLYCPFVYAYSTYAGPVRAPAPGGAGTGGRLTFVDVPAERLGGPLGSIVGGTGLAIFRAGRRPEVALDVAAFVTGRSAQRAMGRLGGQPARRSAWEDAGLDERFDGFYRGKRATIGQAYVRPRYPGYLGLQNEGGDLMEG